MLFKYNKYKYNKYNIINISMESLKSIPEAKYVMDDLMGRTFAAEAKLDLHKQKSEKIIHRIIKNISLLQVHNVGTYILDQKQTSYKESAITDLLKLIEMNNLSE